MNNLVGQLLRVDERVTYGYGKSTVHLVTEVDSILRLGEKRAVIWTVDAEGVRCRFNVSHWTLEALRCGAFIHSTEHRLILFGKALVP